MRDGLPALIEDAEQARAALSPLRLKVLAALREPGSAASLAAKLGIPRQKLGYHLRALEAAGLVRLVEERKRRGFTERVLVSDGFVLDPDMIAPTHGETVQDQFAAAHLIETAAGILRTVTRMASEAGSQGKRLLTLTIEADVGFAEPAMFDAFAQRLSQAAAALARDYPTGKGRRGYRLIIGAHPAVAGRVPKTKN